mgnify:CR=1 FL=1
MNKKILFILPKFEFGGTVFSTFNMIRMLQQHGGFDIYVYPMIADGPIRQVYNSINVLKSDFLLESSFVNLQEYKGVKKLSFFLGKIVKRLSLSKDYNVKQFERVAQKLQMQYHFDFVVSCQEGDSTEFVSYFKDCKRIAWFRSEMTLYLQNHISEDRAKGLKFIYGRMNNIVCVSKTTRDDFAKYFPEFDKRILAIHNIQDIKAIFDKANEIIDDPFDKKYYTLVSVGRMSPQKRFADIPKIASKRVMDGLTDFRWYIIGEGNKNGEYDRLIEELKKYQMHEYVKVIGSRVNPYPYIQSADALVIPSSYEACPRVVAEAHILKVPVISADYSSATEFVHHCVDGFVGNIDELNFYIAEMIKGSDNSKTVIRNCKNFNFDTGYILKQLLNLFS